MFKRFLNRKNGQKGFTLMELMVVIVIVAILAAVAVPLYVNYVRDAQRTEAKGAIGAIVTAQQAYYQKKAGTGTPTYADDLTTLTGENLLDITEPGIKWDFVITSGDANGYSVTATLRDSDPPITVMYAYSRTTGGVFTP